MGFSLGHRWVLREE